MIATGGVGSNPAHGDLEPPMSNLGVSKNLWWTLELVAIFGIWWFTSGYPMFSFEPSIWGGDLKAFGSYGCNGGFTDHPFFGFWEWQPPAGNLRWEHHRNWDLGDLGWLLGIPDMTILLGHLNDDHRILGPILPMDKASSNCINHGITSEPWNLGVTVIVLQWLFQHARLDCCCYIAGHFPWQSLQNYQKLSPWYRHHAPMDGHCIPTISQQRSMLPSCKHRCGRSTVNVDLGFKKRVSLWYFHSLFFFVYLRVYPMKYPDYLPLSQLYSYPNHPKMTNPYKSYIPIIQCPNYIPMISKFVQFSTSPIESPWPSDSYRLSPGMIPSPAAGREMARGRPSNERPIFRRGEALWTGNQNEDLKQHIFCIYI